MAVNYWHRRAGFFEGEWGVYHRTPYNPEFWHAVRLQIPGIQYREEWRAFWVPEGSSYEFERYGMDRNLGTPCPRCRRQEPCTAWPEDRPKEPWENPDFEKQTEEWFRQYENFWKQTDEPIRQQTYGRRVDPDFGDAQRERLRQERERRRQERERAAREPPVQRPPDVRLRAASVLGVEVNATNAEIKAAVRKLAMEHHPDRGGDSGKMAEILGARDVLLGRTVRRGRC